MKITIKEENLESSKSFPKIRNIVVKNYRGLRSAELKDFSQVNLVFGKKNNCGKSSILESVLLMTGLSRLPISIQEQDDIFSFYDSNPENKISIVSEGNMKRELMVEMVQGLSDGVVSDDPNLDYIYKSKPCYGAKLCYIYDGVSSWDRDQYQYKSFIESRYITTGYLNQYIEEAFLDLVEENDEQKEVILDILRIVEPRIKNIQLVEQEIMIDIGMSQLLPIAVLGNGVRKLLCIILAIYTCIDGILIIDEIENGLHFSVMEKIWNTMLAIAFQNNVQLFISTNSIDVIKGLTDCLGGDDQVDNREKIAGFKLIKKEDDTVESVRYDYESLAYSINQNMEMR
jgi:AAA15 family ATPase/GTPase